MKDFYSIKLLDYLKGFFEKLGINHEELKLIVYNKLLMDRKRKSKFIYRDSLKGEERNNSFIFNIIIGAILGFLIMGSNLYLKLKVAIVFSVLMSMIFVMFISEFSNSLLNINDKGILYTRGVSLKTVNAAKIVHITIRILTITISLAGVSIFVCLGDNSFYATAGFIASLIFIDIFMLVFVNLMYSFILKVFKGERLKDVLATVQTFMSSFLLVFSVIICVIAILAKDFASSVAIQDGLWQIFVPPLWYASFMDLITMYNTSVTNVINTVLAIGVPVILVFLYAKNSNMIEKNLEKLTSTDTEEEKKKFKLSDIIGNLICRDEEERIFYKFLNTMIGKDREFKMRITPNIVMGIGIIFLVTFMYGAKIGNIREALTSPYVLLSVFALGIVIAEIIYLIGTSNNNTASWIYLVLPVKKPENMYKGAIKGMLVKYILPSYIFVTIVFTILQGVSALPILIFIGLYFVATTLLLFKIGKKIVPFSKSFKMAKGKEENISLGILIAILLIGVGLTYFAIKVKIVSVILIVAIVIVNFYLYKTVFKVDKKDLYKSFESIMQ